MSKFSEDEKVQILSDLVNIQSVNDNEIDVCNYLHQLFKAHNIYSEIINISDTRANLVAEIGSGKPVLGVSGHMDVVSAGNVDNWTYDPFQLTEESGKLYGRGSADMKSGLAAFVISLIEAYYKKVLSAYLQLLAKKLSAKVQNFIIAKATWMMLMRLLSLNLLKIESYMRIKVLWIFVLVLQVKLHIVPCLN